jgi:CheY-like chemotaxis protein
VPTSCHKRSPRASSEGGIVLTSLRPRRRFGVSQAVPYVGFFSHGALFMETILIVEDEATTRDTLAELLEKDGREIVTAGDGREALERLKEVPRPRLILLDLMMPRMDGREFIHRQLADVSIAHIPTIVLSGSTLPSGATHQLSKPIDVERLLALVGQYC